MEQLRVIGTEDGALVLATESGQRFSLPVDDVVRAELRRSRQHAEPRSSKASPREIQSHVRSGLTAAQVAELLGISIEDVVRFEGPVLAEREHIVDQALAIPVLLGSDFDSTEPPTFGSAVRAKLAEAQAIGERWSSWKDESGWTVKLEFTSADVDHDARWSFDPRRSSLAPLNSDATQLSRQGSLPDGLIPRLRVLDAPAPKDETRFDSGAFGRRGESEPSVAPTPTPTPTAAQDAAIKRAPEERPATAETADLLEALRRRRGQREPQPDADDDEAPARPSSGPVALFDALEPGYDRADDEDEDIVDDATRISSDATRRKGRSAMPSWDEIVFGARSDD